MTESKQKLLQKLREKTGKDLPEWADWPVYKILMELKEDSSDDDTPDLAARIGSDFKKKRKE
jgi:hypothetical protein